MDTVNPTAEIRASGAASEENATPYASETEQIAALTAERDQAIQEKAELQDLLQRRQAEFENFRRRIERERTELFEYASMESVKSLLPILDDFERALNVESADRKYARGMELIYQRQIELLKKLGLEPISTAGATFDPHLHHAVEMVETSDYPDHTILEEFQRGYKFKGRMLRPAMVKVAVDR